MEAIVQNTAYTMDIVDNLRSNVDKFPTRYKILTSADNKDFTNPSTELYAKDKSAYYPFVNPDKGPTLAPKVDIPVYDRPPKYEKDQNAYYNPVGPFKIIPLVKIGTEVPIVLDTLKDKFPSQQNVKDLTQELKSIKARDDIAQDINAIYQKGIYLKDPKAYYDPTVEDTVETVNKITQTIDTMNKELNKNLKDEVTAQLGTIKIHPEVQNSMNAERETRSLMVKENYYTEVTKDKNGKTVELPPTGQTNFPTPPKKLNISPAVDADVVTHSYQDADDVTGQGNTNVTYKGGLVDADGVQPNERQKVSNLRLNREENKKKKDSMTITLPAEQKKNEDKSKFTPLDNDFHVSKRTAKPVVTEITQINNGVEEVLKKYNDKLKMAKNKY